MTLVPSATAAPAKASEHVSHALVADVMVIVVVPPLPKSSSRRLVVHPSDPATHGIAASAFTTTTRDEALRKTAVCSSTREERLEEPALPLSMALSHEHANARPNVLASGGHCDHRLAIVYFHVHASRLVSHSVCVLR
jgi:hypothetical protein